MASPATTATSPFHPATSSFVSSTLRSLITEQTSALDTLTTLSDSDILPCLNFIRSIKSNFQHQPSTSPYSPAQVQALRCLSSAPNEDVQLWLALYRRERHSNRSQNDTRSQEDRDRQHPASGTASYADVVKDGTSAKLAVSTKNAQNSSQTTECSQLLPISKAHRYWSTDPGHERPFKTFDGFRRHENEREKHYIFLPDGIYKKSGEEDRCALCLAESPDQAHFETHGIWDHRESTKATIKKSRQGDFKQLLKNHGLDDHHRIDQLVEECCRTSGKKSFSCGFCIRRFDTLIKRTNHLAKEHYEKGQDKTMWNCDIMIKGLLSESQVNQEYRKCFGMDPSDKDSRLTWNPSIVEGLREILELGKETPQALAQKAHDHATSFEPSTGDGNIVQIGSQFNTESPQQRGMMPPSTMIHPKDASSISSTTDPMGFSTTEVPRSQMEAPQASQGIAQDSEDPFLHSDFPFDNGIPYRAGETLETLETYTTEADFGHSSVGGNVDEYELNRMDFVHDPNPSTGDTSTDRHDQPWHPPFPTVDPSHLVRESM